MGRVLEIAEGVGVVDYCAVTVLDEQVEDGGKNGASPESFLRDAIPVRCVIMATAVLISRRVNSKIKKAKFSFADA